MLPGPQWACRGAQLLLGTTSSSEQQAAAAESSKLLQLLLLLRLADLSGSISSLDK